VRSWVQSPAPLKQNKTNRTTKKQLMKGGAFNSLSQEAGL
jgi:hypothetical protein